MSSTKPHVLILGAGLGGLALAQALRKQGITFEVFERDSSLHSRFQGWAIALHWILSDLKSSFPSDMPPIYQAGHLLPLDLPSQIVVYGETGSKTIIQSTEHVEFLRVNRARFREWLATKIDVQWDRKMTRIEEGDEGIVLHFEDGRTAKGDILVGADGVQSPVRNHLFPSIQPTLIPMAQITGEVTLNKSQYATLLALGHSAYVTSNSSVRLFVGLNSIAADAETASYYWLVGWPSQPPFWTWQAGKEELYQCALEKCRGLDERFTRIVGWTGSEGVRGERLVLREVELGVRDLRGMGNGRITLLGDAAHAMSPFRGEGGNHALKDAVELGRWLGELKMRDGVIDGKEIRRVLGSYEEEMLRRGGEAVRASSEASWGSVRMERKILDGGIEVETCSLVKA